VSTNRSKTKPPVPAEARLGDALARLYYVARRDYQTDLTHRAIRVLQFISYRPEPPGLDAVRAYLDCAPSTASELLKRLQKKGLLTRTRSTSDERAIAIELTAAGEKAVTEHTSLDPSKLKSGIADLGTDEQSTLIQAVEKVIQHLERPSDDRSSDPAISPSGRTGLSVN
jgi:MarR family transcriptional regulator, organic hydroperoxide resistance regulator